MMRAHGKTPGGVTAGRLGRLGRLAVTLAVLATAASAQATGTTKPTFVSQASPSISVGAGSLTDTAILIGDPLSTTEKSPGGTIGFSLYGPDDTTCSNAPVFTQSIDDTTHKQQVVSGSFTPTLPGLYQWVDTYSGDATYAPAAGKCGDSTEQVLVTVVTPTITTVASPSVAVGGSVTDTATLVGGMAPTGTMRFRIYQPSDTSCAGPAVGGSDVAISDPAATVSQPFSPKQVGTYHWRAFYLGDHTNGVAGSKCGDPNESVVVTAAPAAPGSGSPGAPGSGPGSGGGGGAAAKCDPVATARGVLNGILASLTGKPGAAFSTTCSAGLRIVLRAKEIRPGNPGFPHRDGFTTMANVLAHIAPGGPALNFQLNSNGLALRNYALSQGRSLIAFLIVHVRPDKSQVSTEALQITTLG
jgi:hypothetical protein